MKEVRLVIENLEVRKTYFEALKDKARIPYCKACGKLFQFGFPDNEQGICDYLICQENELLCECEYNRIVRNLFSQKEDGLIEIHPYYEILTKII